MITAVILTKNNENGIEATLQSVSWADDIVIVDDYSTDNTLVRVKKYTQRIFQRHLADDFSAQRNFGLEKAKHQWVLFIDSDEVVSEELQHEIQETISRKGTGERGVNGYFIKREDMFFGRTLTHGETGNIKLLRLAKKDSGIWKRPVHEYWDIHGKTDTLSYPLVHHSHTNVAQFISDINQYSTMNARFFYMQGVRANLFTIIAYPLGKFIQNYFLRLGFLDGTPGVVMATMMSFHSFLTRAKLYLLRNNQNP